MLSPPTCPICSAPAVARQRHAVERVAAAHVPPARDADRYGRMLTEIRRLWPGGYVDACACEACALGFAWPLVEGDPGFFGVLHERVGYPAQRWEFKQARDRFIAPAGRVLDIGAGRGDFLASLPAGVEKHAVEASPGLCAALEARGMKAYESLERAAAAGPFDVITMFHVIQYFADPVSALKRVRAMLKPADGRLLLSAPNAKAGGGSITDLPAPPHPLTRWTQRALDRAAAAAGMNVVGFEWIPARPSSLLWAANGRTRARAAEHPASLAGRVDALRPGRVRTALLALLASTALPGVLGNARSRLTRSQMFAVCRPDQDRASMSVPHISNS